MTSEETLEAEQPVNGEVKESASPEGNIPDENEAVERDENHDMLPEETPAPVPDDGPAAEDPQMA